MDNYYRPKGVKIPCGRPSLWSRMDTCESGNICPNCKWILELEQIVSDDEKWHQEFDRGGMQ